MSTVEEKLRALRTRFTRSLPGRSSAIATAMRNLKEGDGDAIRDLERSFHILAGTAGTYGLRAMSLVAGEAEGICERLKLPDEEGLRALESLVETLRTTTDEPAIEQRADDALYTAKRGGRARVEAA